VIEYMFFGLPVLAYDLHETRVSAAEAGVFVNANDERALAKGIVDLLDDPERRERLGAAGYARVRAVLAWNYSVAPLLAAYRAALGLGTVSAELPMPGTSAKPEEAES
jgi:glycosyltransferase involved in cell wall biosynthesis